MASKIESLKSKNLITPPKWLPSNICYEVIVGSIAYGTNSDNSDMDIYGFCIPKKEDIFIGLKGLVPGFDSPKVFEQYLDKAQKNNKSYDLTIFNITKYFKLCSDNNPNMLDTLYVPYNCVLYSNNIGNIVRENRHIFLSKKLYHRFMGYAMSQLHKMNSKGENRSGNRKELYNLHGYDTKFASHLVRLAYECEMLLTECDMDLQRYKDYVKYVKRGESSKEDVEKWFAEKQKTLEQLYRNTKLPNKPRIEEIRNLLIHCLEEHYKNMEHCFQEANKEKLILEKIKELVR